jgi:hypothetical protein
LIITTDFETHIEEGFDQLQELLKIDGKVEATLDGPPSE